MGFRTRMGTAADAVERKPGCRKLPGNILPDLKTVLAYRRTKHDLQFRRHRAAIGHDAYSMAHNAGNSSPPTGMDSRHDTTDSIIEHNRDAVGRENAYGNLRDIGHNAVHAFERSFPFGQGQFKELPPDVAYLCAVDLPWQQQMFVSNTQSLAQTMPA